MRTLAWLFRTSTHLFTHVLDADLGAPDPRFSLSEAAAEPDEDEVAADCARPPLNRVHDFLSAPGERVRSLGRDLSFLNYRPGGRNDAWCLELLERIVRCYALLLYECRATREQRRAELEVPAPGAPKPSKHFFTIDVVALLQKQLNGTLSLLVALYDDARKRSVPGVAELASPHEAEFRAYNLLWNLDNPDTELELQYGLARLPAALLAAPPLAHALRCWRAFRSSDFVYFLRLVRTETGAAPPTPGSRAKPAPRETPYLARCILAQHFPRLRQRALRMLNSAYRQVGSALSCLGANTSPHGPIIAPRLIPFAASQAARARRFRGASSRGSSRCHKEIGGPPCALSASSTACLCGWGRQAWRRWRRRQRARPQRKRKRRARRPAQLASGGEPRQHSYR